MDRRKALRNIGLTTGFVVATPSLLSLLQSCKSDVATWAPEYLTADEGLVVKSLVDIFLPKTDTPSASEVNVPQFIDVYMKEVPMPEEQQEMRSKFDKLIAKLKADYGENLGKVTEENYKAVLDTYLAKGEKTGDDKDIAEILGNLKWMTINAYRNSEVVGETILAYDPVPGAYIGCAPLQELTGGKSWSLS